MTPRGAHGALKTGWSATTGDYAIAGAWGHRGSVLVVADVSGGVFGFESTSGAVRWQRVASHEGNLLAMAMHPSGKTIATSGQDGKVVVCSVDDGRVLRVIELGNGWVEHVAWSPDGQLLAASKSRQVYVYDLDGTEVWQSDPHPSTVSAIAWAGPHELATACYGRVSFFDTSSGELSQKLQWKGSLVSMVLSPSGEVVACGSQDNSVHFWRRSTGEDAMMQGYAGKPSQLAFDEAGLLLATGGGESVTVWSFQGDGPEGSRPGVLSLHVKPITALAFANRGRRLASGGRDGGVVVWSLQGSGDGGPIGAAMVGDVIAELLWRPDDHALACLDASGGVTVWRLRR